MTVLYVRDMLFITHEPPVTVLAVSVRLHMSIISQAGWSALMAAAGRGHTEVVTQLLEAGANTNLQDQVQIITQVGVHWLMTLAHYHVPQEGDTAVIRATLGHHPDTLQKLVRAGADLNLCNKVHTTHCYTLALPLTVHAIRRA